MAVRENPIVLGHFATAGARDDVVHVAFLWREFAAGVLTATAVALQEATGAEARAAQRDLGVVGGDDDVRQAEPRSLA